MCEASKSLKDLTFAKEGDDVVVSRYNGSHGHGQRMFSLASGSRAYCCLPFAATVLFADLPPVIQHRLGIGHEAEAVLASPEITQETHREHRDDLFVLTGGDPSDPKLFRLNELPFGTRCHVVHVPVDVQKTAEAVDEEVTYVIHTPAIAIRRHTITDEHVDERDEAFVHVG
ncbi:MAG: hypothetical protein KW804_00970 [Candidatus Doudnabacteria bacterium]|nr:hypothetical protein [Candidatus Doudnabacteria bacterium]